MSKTRPASRAFRPFSPALRSPSAIVTAALVGASLLSGCSSDIAAHGNLPTEGTMEQLQEGVSTRADVQSLLGTPSSTSMFGGETWYYISNHTTQVAFFKPEELSRLVVAIHFDPTGTVSEVDTLSKDDGRQVDIVSRKTPTRGTEASIIQELFGNIGRFAPTQPE